MLSRLGVATRVTGCRVARLYGHEPPHRTSGGAAGADDDGCAVGAVYALTNAPGENAVLAFRRGADGALQPLPALVGTPAGLAGLAAY